MHLDVSASSADKSTPLPHVGHKRMADTVTKKTDTQYLSALKESPYNFRANKHVKVDGKSALKGSWKRQTNVSEKQA